VGMRVASILSGIRAGEPGTAIDLGVTLPAFVA